jgi:DNA-binding XRE family transcriptional regulator
MRQLKERKKEAMNVNIAKLKGKIIEKGFTPETLATAIGVDRSTMYRKLTAIEKFTIGEARKIKLVLDLTNEEAVEIFLS